MPGGEAGGPGTSVTEGWWHFAAVAGGKQELGGWLWCPCERQRGGGSILVFGARWGGLGKGCSGPLVPRKWLGYLHVG